MKGTSMKRRVVVTLGGAFSVLALVLLMGGFWQVPDAQGQDGACGGDLGCSIGQACGRLVLKGCCFSNLACECSSSHCYNLRAPILRYTFRSDCEGTCCYPIANAPCCQHTLCDDDPPGCGTCNLSPNCGCATGDSWTAYGATWSCEVGVCNLEAE